MILTVFLEWNKILENEISGKQAYRYAARIAQYHRIQASTGYREAVHAVLQLLKRDDVQAERISYPAVYGKRHLASRTFQEWHCDHAELWLEGEQRSRLARFEEEEISLVQRSISTPAEGVEAELVIIENAEDPNSYQDLDLQGKIALVRGNQFVIYDLAVEKHGAIGLIFDNLNEYPPIRTRLDMPDAIQYTSFWWHGQEKKAFGFAVSPRVGESLRQRCKHSTVRVSATVKAKLYDGNYENIEYFIPGRKAQEVLLVSHLCHPYPGGQDNATGPGTLMETMRALTRLIQTGILPQPELGIRFLMMPEMTGTYAYFAQHPERRALTIAALNLDMVGADQSKSGGPLTIESPPMSTPSFVDRFVYQLFESISINTGNFSSTTRYSTIHYLKSRFSGGSDHYIIADPTIGIPCPMLIQWPDRNYHTTEDTVEHLDPNMMKMVALTTSLYAYGLANGTEEDWLKQLTHDVGTRYTDIQKSINWLFNQENIKHNWEEAVTFYSHYEKQALDSYKKYAEVRGFPKLEDKLTEAYQLLEQQLAALKLWSKAKARSEDISSFSTTKQLDPAWKDRILKRVYDGPISLTFELEQLSLEERLSWYSFERSSTVMPGYDVFLQYWIDGKRTFAEVLDCVRLETGAYHPDYAIRYITLCEQLGLIK